MPDTTNTTDTTTADDGLDVLTKDPNAWGIGDEVTVLKSGVTIPWGAPGMGAVTCRRGQILVVSREVLTHQSKFLDFIANPALQVERWGIQKIQRGRLELDAWEVQGDRYWLDARNAARDIAFAHVDPVERAEALREVNRKFGPGPVTSTSTEIRPVGQQRRLADDAAARAQHGRHIIKSQAD